jgi:outer membrane protein TolC
MPILPRLSGRSLVLCWWCLCAPCAAQIVPLRALERRALDNQALAVGEQGRVRGAAAEVRKAASAYHPQVQFKADTTIQPGRQLVTVRDVEGQEYLIQGTRSIGDPGAFAGQTRVGVQFDVNSSLYNFGRTAAAVEAGQAGYAAASAEAHAQRVTLVAQVRSSYLGWLTARELMRIAELSLRDAERQRARVAALIEQGTQPEGELLPVRGEELLARLDFERAHNDLAHARLDLSRVVGTALPSAAEPDPSLLLAEATSSAGPEQDPTLLMLQRQYAAALALARAEKRRRRPELAVGLSAGLRAQGQDLFPFYSAGLIFAAPLWDGGLALASAESARARATQLRAQTLTHAQERHVDRELTQGDLASARERLALAERLRELSQERLLALEAAYDLGSISFDQIGQARAMLRRAQTEELRAKVARTDAVLRLMPIDVAK